MNTNDDRTVIFCVMEKMITAVSPNIPKPFELKYLVLKQTTLRNLK